MSTKQVRPVGEKRKPPAAGMGRKKGSLNKATKALKDMILGALDDVGGQDYMARCAEDPKLAGAFLTLVGKVLPTEVRGAGPGGSHVFERIVREVVDTKG